MPLENIAGKMVLWMRQSPGQGALGLVLGILPSPELKSSRTTGETMGCTVVPSIFLVALLLIGCSLLKTIQHC